MLGKNFSSLASNHLLLLLFLLLLVRSFSGEFFDARLLILCTSIRHSDSPNLAAGLGLGLGLGLGGQPWLRPSDGIRDSSNIESMLASEAGHD